MTCRRLSVDNSELKTPGDPLMGWEGGTLFCVLLPLPDPHSEYWTKIPWVLPAGGGGKGTT